MRQLMMIHLLDTIPDVPAVPGYSIRAFRPGDEEAWVEICRCGLCAEDATISAWNDAILGRAELKPESDVFFACRDADGTPAATTTGYVRSDGVGDIHMVACRYDDRGHGLGAALLSHAMKKLKAELPEEGRRVELTTDDFRLPAIVGYLRGGFHPVLYDEGMEERWRKIAETLNMHGYEMLDEEGKPTGIVL